jgi:hypothetical protein
MKTSYTKKTAFLFFALSEKYRESAPFSQKNFCCKNLGFLKIKSFKNSLYQCCGAASF